MNRLLRTLRQEDGATAILFAIVLPVLLSMIGFGSEVVAITGADRELQRTADQAALTAAAQIPLGDLGALSGGFVSSNEILTALTPGTNGPLADACALAEANAATSSLLVGFAAQLPACTNGAITIAPVAGRPAPTLRLLDVLDAVDAITGPLATIGGGGIISVTDLLADLGIPVDMIALTPALAASNMQATVRADVSTPLRNFITDDATTPLSASATARRRFKNVLLLPVGDLCAPPAALVLTDEVLALLQGIIGPQALADLLTDTGIVPLPEILPEELPEEEVVDDLVEELPEDLPADPEDPPAPPAVPAPPPPPPAPEPPAPPGIPVPEDPVPDGTTTTASRSYQAAQDGPIIEVPEVLEDIVPVLPTPEEIIASVPDGASLPLNEAGELASQGSALTQATINQVLAATGALGLTGAGCRIDLNQIVTPLAVQQLDAVLTAMEQQLAAAPPGVPAAQELSALLSDIHLDLLDLLDPGPDAPTTTEVLQAAATADEDILVVAIGSTQIPALDFVLRPARDIMDIAGGVGGLSDLDVDATMNTTGSLLTQVAGARGLFRATLVD